MFSEIENLVKQAKGKMSSGKLLYVQYVDPNTKTMHEITDPFLKDFILDVKFSDPYFTHYASSTRDSNIDILKNALSDEIINVYVYSCPMEGFPEWMPHTYAIFQTQDTQKKQMWWSFEKNGEYTLLQQSPREEDVTHHIYDNEENQTFSRPETVKKEISAQAQGTLENLLRYFWNAGQLPRSYHLFLSNCWQFAELIFEKLNTEREKWTPHVGYKILKVIKPLSSTVIERPGLDAAEIVMDYSNQIDDQNAINASLRLAIRDGDLEKLKELLEKHPETIDRTDARGYTLIEWAQVFSKRAEKYLKEINPVRQVHEEKKNYQLFIALLGNKTPETNLITKESVNATNSLGETPLHLAAKLSSCTTETFEMLLEKAKPVNVNKVDNYGYTPLHWALYTRSLEKIKRLIDKRADIEIQVNDVNGESPLHLAVQRWGNAPEEEFKKIQELLAQTLTTKGAVETKTKKGYTALHSALLLQSETFATFLLDQGADVDIATEKGSTSLHLAVQWPGCPEELLCRILNSTIKNLHAIKTALHYALESQSSIACKVLLKKKENGVDIVTADGETALHLAAKWPGMCPKLFTTILEKTNDMNKQDSKGRTPLHCALLFKSVTATKKLLNEGAIINAEAQRFDRITALHLAAFWSDIPINLFEIILHGKPEAYLNAQDQYGRTALHCAILSKSETLIDKLLDGNVDATIHDKDDIRPLHLAAMWRLQYKHSPSQDALNSQGGQRYQRLSSYKLDENVPDISIRLFKKIMDQYSTTVNAQSSRRETALHLALASHSANATDELLKHKDLDVNIKGIEGEMAIHLAAKWQSIPLCLFRKIIERTVNLNEKHFGNTALDYARESKLPQEWFNLLLTAMDNPHKPITKYFNIPLGQTSSSNL